MDKPEASAIRKYSDNDEESGGQWCLPYELFVKRG
jgi:hypothetical protein